MLASLLAIAVAGVDPVPDTATGSSGLPQLDANDFAPQLLWLAITFGALYALLARIVLPRIGSVIEGRRERIQRDLDEAERLKAATEKALAAYEEALAMARGKANEIARRTREKLAADVEAERARVDQQIRAKLAEAEARIADTKSKAMAHVSEIAAETAQAIVAKLIGKETDEAEVRLPVKARAGE